MMNYFELSRGKAEEWLEDCGLDLKVRGEALSLPETARLSDRIGQDILL